jgi:hypothetical protein
MSFILDDGVLVENLNGKEMVRCPRFSVFPDSLKTGQRTAAWVFKMLGVQARSDQSTRNDRASSEEFSIIGVLGCIAWRIN